MNESEAMDEAIGEMADDFIERRRAGKRPSIADYVAKKPEARAKIEAVLSALIALEDAGRGSVVPEAPRKIADFDIVREIGRGGMGVVYEAKQRSLGRRVALKLMTPSFVARPEAYERFRREATVAAKIDHPGVCAIYDAGIEGSTPYIAMQFIDGETLAARIAERRTPKAGVIGSDRSRSTPKADDPETMPLDRAIRFVGPVRDNSTPISLDPEEIDEILRIFELVARALEAAHGSGVLHRDVKPGNIMITRAGVPIVTDFGLARDFSGADEESALTMTGDLLGTPAYLAPEQLRGAAASRSTDVYALGVSLYEALCGRRPFAAPTREAIYDAILRRSPERPRLLCPNLPRDAETVLLTAMEKDPARRYARAIDFADDLERAREHRPILARPPSVLGQIARWVRRRPAAAGMLLSSFLVLLLGALFLGYYIAVRDDVDLAREETARRETEDRLARGFFEVGFGTPTAAVPIFEEAVREDPSDEAVAGLALSLLECGRNDDAIATIKNRTGLLERVPSTRFIMATALKEIGRSDEAKSAIQGLHDPKSSVDYFVRGLSNLSRGVRGDRDAAVLAWQDFTEAMATSDRVRDIHHISRIRAAGATANKDLLSRSESAYLSTRSDSAIAWIAIGSARESCRDPKGAAQAFGRAAHLDPRNVEAWSRQADMHRVTGNLDAAEDAVAKALAIDSGAFLARLARALVAEVRGDARTDEFFREALAAQPDSASVRTHMARRARARGDLETAHGLLLEAYRLAPRDGAVVHGLAIAEFERGNSAEGQKHVREAVRLNPSAGNYRHSLSIALRMEGKDDEALAEARAAHRLAPDDADFAYDVGVWLCETGPIDEAEAALRSCIAIDPDRGEAHCLLGRVLLRAKKYDDALESLEKGLASNKLNDLFRAEARAWRKQCEDALDR